MTSYIRMRVFEMDLNAIENKTTEAVDNLSKSVVTIKSRKEIRDFPFGSTQVQGSGSGFIIDQNGYIVTNYHVIDGASEVDVMLKDGRTYPGKVIGGDKATDIVLIKVAEGSLPAAKLGDSEKLKVGQFALAIGDALDLPGAPTVSLGVISAVARPLPWADFIFEGMIQTDAAINPGNSGGPLADINGSVIGMNTAMVPFAQGVGFAIPINTIKWVIEQVLEKGRVIRPMLGVSAINLTPAISRRFNLGAESGALVAKVFPNSPAYHANIREGDIIERIGPHEVKSIRDLLVAISKTPIDENISVKVLRLRKRHDVKLKLMQAPIENA